jgi:hypothetical protein
MSTQVDGMSQRRVAIDSNALTYLLDAVCDGYLPCADPDPGGPERVAMFRVFCYLTERPWVGPTVRAEYAAIVDASKREEHDRWTRYHLEDFELTGDAESVDARAKELKNHHCHLDDCRVVAEAEAAGAEVLLTCDARMIKHLGSRTGLALMRPTAFIASLAIPPGTPPHSVPADGNPLATQTWWRI